MILVDAGPLVALADSNDAHHAVCFETLKRIRGPTGTVWPALTEAMHLTRRWPEAQSVLFNLVESGSLQLCALDASDAPRIRELMTKYRELPMDLADAALVRVAERERIRTVFTIDKRDFAVYRAAGIGKLRVIP